MRTLTVFLISGVAAWFLPFVFESTWAHANQEPKPEAVTIDHSVEVNCAEKHRAATASAVALPSQGLIFIDGGGYIACRTKNQLIFEAHYVCVGGKFVIPSNVPFATAKLECVGNS